MKPSQTAKSRRAADQRRAGAEAAAAALRRADPKVLREWMKTTLAMHTRRVSPTRGLEPVTKSFSTGTPVGNKQE